MGDKYNFSGWATVNGLKCADGRVISKDAFKDNDGMTVPLVWQHQHGGVENVLGHAILQNEAEGVYAFGFFNDTEAGEHARQSVENGDITSLSIYANQLEQKGPNVVHGQIRELSLVMSGANPGALIDNVNLMHGEDGFDEEAIIYTGTELFHAEDSEEPEDPEEDDEEMDIEAILATMNEEQTEAMNILVGMALEEGSEGPEQNEGDDDMSHGYLGDDYTMRNNVFEQNGLAHGQEILSQDEISEILQHAADTKTSVKEAFLAHAATYGIDNIDILFPDAKAISDKPEFIKNGDEWVGGVLGGVRKSPFARIKSLQADITGEEARARGYIKGNLKKEEVIRLMKRSTGPVTIYKKQKLDRDDIVDITSLDVVAWLKEEMRIMLNAEIARAILIGDGRVTDSDDKIRDPYTSTEEGTGIRSIANDHELYTTRLKLENEFNAITFMDKLTMARKDFKGTGKPTLYCRGEVLYSMLLLRDGLGHRVYANLDEIKSALMVADIVEVPQMEGAKLADGKGDIVGVLVNMSDYVLGADAKGALNLFDDFDIDYNQYKYLMETRLSGALEKPKTAICIHADAITFPSNHTVLLPKGGHTVLPNPDTQEGQ